MPASQRIQAVQPPIIPIVSELIQRHPGTISLGQGIVHYPPPASAITAMASTLNEPGRHGYSHVAGLPVLLDRIAAKLEADNGIRLGHANDVVVTAGANMGFANAILAIVDPGDEIILPRPYYFNHHMAVEMAGGHAVVVDTDADYGLRLDAIERAITPRTRAVVTVSPNNPTGAVYDEATLRAVNALCRAHGLYHISDEAYEYFTYDEARHFSPGSIDGASEHTVSLYSLSKSYGFAGWRIGYMVIPAHLTASVKKIQDTILICPPVPSQLAAAGALEAGPGYCRRFLGPMAEMRDIVHRGLSRLSDRLTVPRPHGAFYVFARLHTDQAALAVVRQLVERHRVAAIPGETFGMTDGCYLRIAYGALQRDTVAEAIERLVQGLGEIVPAAG